MSARNPLRGFRPQAILATLAAALIPAVFSAQPNTRPLPVDFRLPRLACGTVGDRHLLGIQPRAVAGIADGEPLGFDQDPPLVFPDHAGSITLRNFEVVGDYQTVQFLRFDPDSPDGQPETWERQTSRTVGGRVVSIFEPRWSDADLARTLSRTRFGFDAPQIVWGTFVTPEASARRLVFLRVGLGGIPSSSVVRLNDRVQYASNVVNLVMPDFGDSRVAGGPDAFDLPAVSQAFYRDFADDYDVLAVIPQRTPVADFVAFHLNVQNTVRGLNIPLFDRSRSYGSAGALKGIELYAASTAARTDIVNHETVHQWGSNFDWTTIAGIARAGSQPSTHAPLWTGGETLLGAVLNPDRRVRTVPDTGAYEIERTPAPVRFHPMELYSMGAIPRDQVPDFLVFADQGQFDADHATSPEPGTSVNGETRAVSILDVVREHGGREGPSPTEWRRATVLVSRERLASEREMDYWNFFVQRLADRNRGVAPTLEGYRPFRATANEAIALRTTIQPREGDALAEELNIDSPSFGPRDWRDVEFSSPVPTRFEIGQTVTLTGRIRAAEPRDFDEIGLVFFSLAAPEPVSFHGSVRRSGDFSINVGFTNDQRGQYSVGAFLFWPDSGPQYARTYLSSVSVNGQRVVIPPRRPVER